MCQLAHPQPPATVPVRSSQKRVHTLPPKVPGTEARCLKLPKVLRRGCKRCFGVCGPKACCTGAKEGCPWCKTGLHWCKRLLGNYFSRWPNHLLYPHLTTLGNFEVSGLCSRHSGSQYITTFRLHKNSFLEFMFENYIARIRLTQRITRKNRLGIIFLENLMSVT